MTRSPRKIHKYLSLAISVQLLLWTISGIYFSFNKIEDVRGSQYLRTTEVIETPKGNKIEPQQALLIVADKTFLKPISVVEITEDKAGSEYRGRSLPLYMIETINKESEEINVYLDPFSEEIVAIRSNQWRIWDFMWGIHSDFHKVKLLSTGSPSATRWRIRWILTDAAVPSGIL